MKAFDNLKIGISGVRGVIGETLSPELVVNLTRAFSTLVQSGKVAVARDTRVSGELIKNAVFSGLVYSGITPVDTGILSTPSLQNYVKAERLDGGIIITASHNPKEWNGLKFVDENGLFLFPFRAAHMIDIYHQRDFISPANNWFPEVQVDARAFEIHKRRIFKIIDVEKIRSCRFRVLMDPGAGAGVPYDKAFLEELGCRVEMIHCEIKDSFPRNPEPLPENLVTASEKIRAGNFDVGFAQDADADRLALLDDQGNALEGEYALAISLMGYLKGKEKGRVVFNLSTSKISEYVSEKEGFEVHYAPVGEINVVEKMISLGALAGGEGNGGVIIPAVHHCRDSFTGMALTLENMAKSGLKLSEIVAQLPDYKRIKMKIPFSMMGAARVVSMFKELYPGANIEDGVRVDGQDYWFHVRPSNTEPVLRLMAEGPYGKIEKIVEEVQSRIENMS